MLTSLVLLYVLGLEPAVLDLANIVDAIRISKGAVLELHSITVGPRRAGSREPCSVLRHRIKASSSALLLAHADQP